MAMIIPFFLLVVVALQQIDPFALSLLVQNTELYASMV
jgi:hypothetical protein